MARGDGLHLSAFARGHQHHEAGQVIGVRAQAVEHPGAHAGASRDDGAGIHQGVGGVVIDLLGPHGADDADVVGDAADVGEQRADLLAGFAEFLERMLGAEADEALALQLGDLLPLGEGVRHGLAAQFGELGLVVEGFQVRRAAGLIEEDDALGLGGKCSGLTTPVEANRRRSSSEFRPSRPTPERPLRRKVRRQTSVFVDSDSIWILVNSA